jgi:prepilin-type N-terminal cleavage/methylation domain-containing protein
MRSLSLRDDDGFTLVELMVVLAVMAVLMVEAVANFQLIQQVAAARAAEGDIRIAFESVRIYYVESGVYTPDAAQMQTVEPAIAWTTSELDGGVAHNTVYLATADDAQTVVLATRASGKCYFMQDKVGGTTFAVTAVAPGATCAVPADAAFSGSWPA